MSRILTCTWAPTAIAGPKLTRGDVRKSGLATASGGDLAARLSTPVERAESLGIDHLLVAQRWWGTGEEIEASSFDCLAMTAYYAAITSRIRLVTAIHPGFFLPAAVAKWGATLDWHRAARSALPSTPSHSVAKQTGRPKMSWIP